MIVAQVPPADLLIRGDEALALFESQVVRLSPLGLALFAATADPQPVEALAETLRAQFGSPPEGDLLAATEEAVRWLVAVGVLRIVEDGSP